MLQIATSLEHLQIASYSKTRGWQIRRRGQVLAFSEHSLVTIISKRCGWQQEGARVVAVDMRVAFKQFPEASRTCQARHYRESLGADEAHHVAIEVAVASAGDIAFIIC